MSTIVTITFNPCIDKNISVNKLIPVKKIRSDSPDMEPGGGGINVARGIHRLGGNTTAIYLAGGYHGQLLTELLKKEELDILPVKIDDNTRESWMILENSSNKQYRFVMPGPAIKQSEWLSLLSKLESVSGVKYIVISGSIPDSIPKNFIESIGTIAIQKNAKLIIDISGDALQRALTYGVYMIKPNLNELASVIIAFGLTEKSITAAAQEIVARGYCEVVVVSMGGAGALLVSKDIVSEIQPPPVNIKSTVGAGDSMVAGIVQSLVDKKNLEDALRYGVACGTAATMNQGTALFHVKDVENLYWSIQKKFLKIMQHNETLYDINQ
jgi:6-phosphofructokinase 2